MVLSVLGLLVAMALPLLGRGRLPLRVAAIELAAHIREVRIAAIASGEGSGVVFFLFDDRYRLELPGSRRLVKLPAGVHFAACNFPLELGRYTLSFRHTGAPNRGGHVVLRDDKGRRLYVIVTPVTGRVRIDEKPPK